MGSSPSATFNSGLSFPRIESPRAQRTHADKHINISFHMLHVSRISSWRTLEKALCWRVLTLRAPVFPYNSREASRSWQPRSARCWLEPDARQEIKTFIFTAVFSGLALTRYSYIEGVGGSCNLILKHNQVIHCFLRRVGVFGATSILIV
ncbi:hypothetical protein K437DRAFT_2875 [Tilletiaria anomala UBC 951]|uniref:Uncharacterized protein n=1 Tax=Tilletiaria anomala (strain ATCC 24038 / CBS 436.72 / UBC 951) TaxID=1037660 RepID=A0A066WSB8_TILAU|nr:uncharacterized protein K437DRAFT_2875 [Tilletiaria anomala UBC 951]KDN53585.1 hypothetical protein K437DRAFT_2875 [Tilletiaria anomala UBC 951]